MLLVAQAGAQGLAVGINYNPCIISTSARGADATAAGVNIQPNVRTPGAAPQLAGVLCLCHPPLQQMSPLAADVPGCALQSLPCLHGRPWAAPAWPGCSVRGTGSVRRPERLAAVVGR